MTTPTTQPLTRYDESDKDVIAAVTRTLIQNIGTGNYNMARSDFTLLMEKIKSRGQQGKDIRYVEKELGELARGARKGYHTDIAREANKYIDQLPKTLDGRKAGDLERIVS